MTRGARLISDAPAQPAEREAVVRGPWCDVDESPRLGADLTAWFADRWHALRQRAVAYYVYRHRYLACFTAIGFASILLELATLGWLPAAWPWGARAAAAFVVGLVLSLVLNVTLNFRVPRRYLLRTSAAFVAISLCSFGLNAALVGFLRATTGVDYGALRLVISGALFLVAYSFHRRFTFDQSRSFGIAVYAAEPENVDSIFERVGHFCDHVHVDLVDETVNAAAAPVQLDRVDEARELWRGYPICLHVMSRRPRQWVEQLWDRVDWVLLPCESEDDLLELVFECRLRGKRPGVVWRQGIEARQLMPLLPHVDFVMVLGIAEPGRSGQALSDEGLAVARTLDAMRPHYGYELMFDGGVKTTNIGAIPGRYVVSASAVLNADQPTDAAYYLRKSPYSARPRRRAA